MKKIVAMMLALMLVLVSLSAMAQSTEPEDSHLTTATDLPLTKAYTMTIQKAYVNNDTENSTADAPHPADVETFFVGDGSTKTEGNATTKAPEYYRNGTKDTTVTIPSITLSTSTISEGAAIPTITATLASGTNFTAAGEYVYYIYETVGDEDKTAGVTYNYLENPLILKITVIYKTDKDSEDNPYYVLDNNGNQILQIGGVALRLGDLNLKNANNSTNKLDAADGNKDNVHNEYEFGKLTVTKTVTGNMGDTTKPWIFEAKFETTNDEVVRGTIKLGGTTDKTGTYYGETAPTADATTGAVSGTASDDTSIAAGDDGWTSKTVYFTLTSGQDFTFDNIPEGVKYTITEVEANKYGYTTTKTGDSGTMSAEGDETAAFINDNNQTPDTGIALDAVPYMMIMAIALMGVAMMISRRRREEM